MCKSTIQKNSIEEELLFKDIISSIKILNISNLLDISLLKKVVNDFAKNMNNTQSKNIKLTNVTKYSKNWWDDKYSRDLKRYRALKSLKNWKSFHKTVKNTKKMFFDLKIMEIANKKCGP